MYFYSVLVYISAIPENNILKHTDNNTFSVWSWQRAKLNFQFKSVKYIPIAKLCFNTEIKGHSLQYAGMGTGFSTQDVADL